jgi:hypothetical protein
MIILKIRFNLNFMSILRKKIVNKDKLNKKRMLIQKDRHFLMKIEDLTIKMEVII